MSFRLSCLVLTLIVAGFGNSEDAPSTIGQILKIPVVSGGPNTVKETEMRTIGLLEHSKDEIISTTPRVNQEPGGNDGYKRLIRNAGSGIQPIVGTGSRFSSGLQSSSMYPRYPLPYRALSGYGQHRGFSRGQWNQEGIGRTGPVYPLRPGIGPVKQNPGRFWPVSQRPFNNPMQFGGPRYPQGVYPGPIGGHPDFAGQVNQNGNKFNPEQDGVDLNLDISFSDWDQIPVGLILADVNENEQGTISAQIAMVVFPELSDDIPYLPQNERTRL